VTFTPDVYEQIRAGAQRSAAVIAPLVYEMAHPTTVIDIGCGEGWFARAFARLGCVVEAVDPAQTEAQEEVQGDGATRGLVCFHQQSVDDLRAPETPWDLAVCLEVAEHLPETAADHLVLSLAHAAPVILFSAAIPGQSGHGHVNCQWPAYWVERFKQHGFEVSGELRWRIWNDERVESWYRQNILVAVDRQRVDSDVWNHLGNELFGPTAFDDPIAVVHPDIWAWKLG
jgi:SAM-dependent methyltransferase